MAQKFDFLFFILFVNAVFIIVAPRSKADFTVFDTRKTLTLSDAEPVYRDYYVNIGKGDGVREGSILDVYRKIPVVDIYRNKTPGDLVIQIARLKVIHAQDQMSVARIYQEENSKNIPVVQFEKVMLGDRVELNLNHQKSSQVAKTHEKKSDDDADDDDEDSDDTSVTLK